MRVEELAAFRGSLAMRRRLAGLDPTNPQWRHDEACILHHIGDFYLTAGKTQEAIATYEAGVAIWRHLANLARRDPQRQLIVTMSLKKLGDLKFEAADRRGAIAAYEQGVVFWRRILKTNPDNTRWHSSFAESLERIGDLKLEAGENNAALAAYEEMLSVDRQLLGIDASNAQWRWNLSLSLERIGEVNLILGNLTAAGAAYDESLIIRHHLVDLDPSNALWQDGIALMQKRIGELRCAAEANALAEASGSRPELLSGTDNVSRELQEQLLLTVGRLRDMGDVVIKKVLAAYADRLADVRDIIQQRTRPNVMAVYRKLSLKFREVNARARTGLLRYWRGSEAFIKSLSPKVSVGAQVFEHATETVRLALSRLLSWSAPNGSQVGPSSQRVSLQLEATEEHDSAPDNKLAIIRLPDAASGPYTRRIFLRCASIATCSGRLPG